MILSIIGTKAQYIKMAPVLLEMQRRGVSQRLLMTGQHSETFDELRTSFGLPGGELNLFPGHEADTNRRFASWIFRARQRAGSADVRSLVRAASAVLVHGDTASTLLGAHLARRESRPVVHVEAGLRSRNLLNPFPEELTRLLVSRLSSHFLCPGAQYVSNVSGLVAADRVVDTRHNTLLDALKLAVARAEGAPQETRDDRFCVLSFHRTENLSSATRRDWILRLAERVSARMRVEFVLHPATRKRLQATGEFASLESNPAIRLRVRSDYFQFIALLRHAAFLLTDGGSNQEEAAMLGLPCLLLRATTERSDGIDDGVVLSRYNDEVANSFVERYGGGGWQMRSMPEASPSQTAVDALERWFS